LEETKRIIKKMQKVTVEHFVVRKLENPHILRAPIFKQTRKKTARITRVNTVYGPTFGNAESRLFLFAAQCFNTESMQKVTLRHICV
jgi:hypothetical protein